MEQISGSIRIRPNGPMQLGQVCPNHKHNFDHTTICFSGAFRVVAVHEDGNRIESIIKSPRPGYDGPSHLLIAAHVFHEFTAIEPDSIFWCVYSHRSQDGEVVLEYEGFNAAYGTWLGNVDPRDTR